MIIFKEQICIQAAVMVIMYLDAARIARIVQQLLSLLNQVLGGVCQVSWNNFCVDVGMCVCIPHPP